MLVIIKIFSACFERNNKTLKNKRDITI